MAGAVNEDAAYAARQIRAFLDGDGGDWDWDDFTSCSLGDPAADRIRRRAAAVDLPVGSEERSTLLGLAAEAEALATEGDTTLPLRRLSAPPFPGGGG
jgi:hypothetical protein